MRLSDFLRARRKRRTIKAYITQLGPLLARRYGLAEHYPPAQVRRVLQESGLPPDQAEYALVRFCTPEQFAADQAARGEASDYWQLRTQIMEYDFRRGPDITPGDGNIGGTFADGGGDASYGGGHHG